MAAFHLYEAKTSRSQLVERAAHGEEIVIAKAGRPMVKMVPITKEKTRETEVRAERTRYDVHLAGPV